MLNNKSILLAFLLLLTTPLLAEVVVLNSGKTIKGEIVLHNDEVVIIRTSNGSRFQYPTSDIKNIEQNEQKTSDSSSKTVQKSTSINPDMVFESSLLAFFLPDSKSSISFNIDCAPLTSFLIAASPIVAVYMALTSAAVL